MSSARLRTIRNVTALLVMLSGISQVAQLWLRDIDRTTLVIAAMGILYLLMGLGLSGQSRFSLWITTAIVIAHGFAGAAFLMPARFDPGLAFNIALDVFVAILCLYTLFRLIQHRA